MKYTELLAQIRECPFCTIAPEQKIAETENVFLTFALAPYHPDHLLVCPKRHTEHLGEVTDKEVSEVDILQKKGFNILQKLGYKNISFLVREGDNTRKSIGHVHYHIVPDIALGTMTHGGFEREVLSKEEISKMISRLKSAI